MMAQSELDFFQATQLRSNTGQGERLKYLESPAAAETDRADSAVLDWSEKRTHWRVIDRFSRSLPAEQFWADTQIVTERRENHEKGKVTFEWASTTHSVVLQSTLHSPVSSAVQTDSYRWHWNSERARAQTRRCQCWQCWASASWLQLRVLHYSLHNHCTL